MKKEPIFELSEGNFEPINSWEFNIGSGFPRLGVEMINYKAKTDGTIKHLKERYWADSEITILEFVYNPDTHDFPVMYIDFKERENFRNDFVELYKKYDKRFKDKE